MQITLEMVDQVIDRTGATYQEAKDALQETSGHVLEAVVLLESQEKKLDNKNIFIERLKDLIEKGRISRIIIEKDSEVIINVPVLAGVVGSLFFITPIFISITAAVVSGCDLYIVDLNNKKINIKELGKSKYDNFVNKDKDLNKSEDEEN